MRRDPRQPPGGRDRLITCDDARQRPAWDERAGPPDAWRDSHRLSAIDGAWGAAGVRLGTDESLAKLRSLVRMRLEPAATDHVAPAHAGALSDEARAIGDDELAAELSTHARRSGTYR